jgi:hypothetical protein
MCGTDRATIIQVWEVKFMKRKMGERVLFGAEHYIVVGVNAETHEYCLEPEEGAEIDKLGNRIWAYAKDIR